MKNPIFISYSRKDKEIVFPLVKQIESQLKTKCWIDWDGIQSGDEFRDNIIQAIDKSEVVLFMLSDNSEKSSFIKKEIDYAKNIEKRIIPIIVDGGKLRGWFLFEFGNIDYIDVSNHDHLQKLFRDLKQMLGIQDEPSTLNDGTNLKKISLAIKDNKITLDIVDKFSFVLEKDNINNVFIGNIPVREILNEVKTSNDINSLTAQYLQTAAESVAIPFLFSPIAIAAYLGYKFLKNNERLSEIEPKAFSAIIAEINNRYNILLERVSDDVRNSTTIPLTDFAVSLDMTKMENKRLSLKDKLHKLLGEETKEEGQSAILNKPKK